MEETNAYDYNNLQELRAGVEQTETVRYWDTPGRKAGHAPRLSVMVRLMARGFESKSVESQQEEAQRARTIKPELTAEEQARQARKTGLELALAQTQAEMAAACRPAHREMLKLRLDAIRAQIRDL